MKVLATVWFWLVFAVTAPVLVVVGACVALLTASRDPDRRILHALITRCTHAYLHLNPFWDVKVLHRERLPAGAAVLVANHQSMADVLAAMGLAHPFKFVSKKSLFHLPLVGWMMSMLKYIPVERGKSSSMQQMMEDCRRSLRAGMSVLLFPEGTYSPNDQLLPFKRGAFQLAIAERVPLVPILIEGTRSLVVGDGPWLNARCRIRVTVLPPLPPDSLGDDDAALSVRVRQLFEERLVR